LIERGTVLPTCLSSYRHVAALGISLDSKGSIAMQAWLALVFAGLLEIGWALGLKYSDGFTRFWPSLATVLAIGSSFGLLGVALESVPFGTAYAVWTGIGAMGTAIVGITLFGEPTDIGRVVCLALILTGIIGLKIATPH
jgi:quaternary ammonium compound-resistance protein SugE